MFEIADMNMRGFGIARDGGAVVFVEGAVDGDVCEIETVAVAKNYKRARIASLLSPSPHRCEPSCPVFGECGGCSLRHVSYEHELEIKRRSVAQAFRKYGMTVDVGEIAAGEPDAYRNKASFRRDGASGALGYYRAESHDFVYPATGRCLLIPPRFDEIREFAGNYPHAEIEALELRRGDGGEICAAARFDSGDAASFAEALMKEFRDVVSVWKISGKSDFSLVRGEREIHITLGGVRFTVVPSAFFQVNATCAESLVGTVREFAALGDREKCADLYCGCGTFALTLAAAYPRARIVGIEISADAIDCAKRSAAWNGLENARFYAGDAAAFADRLEGVGVIVVDPPRSGLSKALVRQILELEPERVVYVSCNPETLARDVAALGERYALERLRCVDLFPRTGNVETVVMLSQQKPKLIYDYKS